MLYCKQSVLEDEKYKVNIKMMRKNHPIFHLPTAMIITIPAITPPIIIICNSVPYTALHCQLLRLQNKCLNVAPGGAEILQLNNRNAQHAYGDLFCSLYSGGYHAVLSAHCKLGQATQCSQHSATAALDAMNIPVQYK